jgi:septal ring factor EnvC (AmiA/AmiB activator)
MSIPKIERRTMYKQRRDDNTCPMTPEMAYAQIEQLQQLGRTIHGLCEKINLDSTITSSNAKQLELVAKSIDRLQINFTEHVRNYDTSQSEIKVLTEAINRGKGGIAVLLIAGTVVAWLVSYFDFP